MEQEDKKIRLLFTLSTKSIFLLKYHNWHFTAMLMILCHFNLFYFHRALAKKKDWRISFKKGKIEILYRFIKKNAFGGAKKKQQNKTKWVRKKKKNLNHPQIPPAPANQQKSVYENKIKKEKKMYPSSLHSHVCMAGWQQMGLVRFA